MRWRLTAWAVWRASDSSWTFAFQFTAHAGVAPGRCGAGWVWPERKIDADHFRKPLRWWLAATSACHLWRDAMPENKRADLVAKIRAWTHNRQMERVTDYVSRGRAYQHSPIEELEVAWIDTYRANTRRPVLELARQEAVLEAEFFLRQRVRPFDL